MITSRELGERYDSALLAKACCPFCLSHLIHRPGTGAEDALECTSCGAKFPVLEGLPIFLLDDQNWMKKADEIEGEVLYNERKIPMEVHIERTTFVNGNTAAFLAASRTDLSRDDVLIVGCSMAELMFFAPRSEHVTCLDIGPRLVADSREATLGSGISGSWVCGDGECLPFENESFDAVIVRQSLHHMLQYVSAICEFFRVCRRGGRVLIIDEPFSPPTTEDVELLSGADTEVLFDSVRLGDVRNQLGARRAQGPGKDPMIDIEHLERERPYIEPNRSDPESLLADKYHSFSLVSCIAAVRQHTVSYSLDWPREIAWTDDSGKFVRFLHGPNPRFDKSLLERIVSPGNVSLVAVKTERTRVFRNRSGLRPIPSAVARRLSGFEGAVVQFQSGRVDPSVLRSGWSVPETWGVWSDGPEARLVLDPMPVLVVNGDLLLIVRATAFTVPQYPHQLLDVLVNDMPLSLWTFKAGDGSVERRARVPAPVVTFPLIITFRLRNPISPAELGVSDDARRLGIGLIHLCLLPSPADG
jgi:SAM-dependent methyltransferase